jgi:hypothetical protein
VTRRGAASSGRRWPQAAPGGAGWQAACSLAGCWLQADTDNTVCSVYPIARTVPAMSCQSSTTVRLCVNHESMAAGGAHDICERERERVSERVSAQ